MERSFVLVIVFLSSLGKIKLRDGGFISISVKFILLLMLIYIWSVKFLTALSHHICIENVVLIFLVKKAQFERSLYCFSEKVD